MTAVPGRWWLTAVVVIVTAALLSPFYWVLIGSVNEAAPLDHLPVFFREDGALAK